jgi:hypothetical protein
MPRISSAQDPKRHQRSAPFCIALERERSRQSTFIPASFAARSDLLEFGFYHLARTNNFEIDDVRGGGWSLASLLNDGGSKPNNEPSPTDRCDVASNFEIAFVNSLT